MDLKKLKKRCELELPPNYTATISYYTELEIALKKATNDRTAIIKECADQIPTTWFDAILTGKDAVVGEHPWGCPEVEAILKAVKKRILSRVDL